ncbi:adenosine deaminase [Lachnospiraceae bacterium 2_1_46FAA]|nr:adenosine deaminase [Lachnospiraceae bacterium 2_1_46FAA]
MVIPKVELHCHLDGSLPIQTVSELLGREVRQSELQVSEDCRNLAEYLEKFDLPLQCLQTEEGLKKASKAFLMDLQKDNVQYVEVRFAPLLSVNEHLNCRRVIQSVIEGLEEAKKECNIFYNVIACAMRHHSEEENLEMMKVAREFLGEGLCAVDLAGNEAAFPMENYVELFGEAKKLGLPFTIHAGECGRVENVIQSVECGAARIGHGIALRGNRDGIALCKEKGIGIEMCPISNLQTKAVQNPSEYPLREFIDAGLRVTINTDNRTVSNSSLQKEMEFVKKQYGITDDELIKLTGNAIDVAFAEDSVKEELWRRLRGV